MRWSQTLNTLANISWLELSKDALKVGVASLFLALSSQIAFPCPISPVPVTMQTFAIFIIGVALGPKRAFLAVLLYLFEGAIGLPVFSLGRGGIVALFGPRGGYLLGFALAAYLSGYLIRKTENYWGIAASFLVANAAIYLLGLSWLSLWIEKESVFALGLYPFVMGDLLKIFAAAAVVKGTQHFKIDKIQKVFYT